MTMPSSFIKYFGREVIHVVKIIVRYYAEHQFVSLKTVSSICIIQIFQKELI